MPSQCRKLDGRAVGDTELSDGVPATVAAFPGTTSARLVDTSTSDIIVTGRKDVH